MKAGPLSNGPFLTTPLSTDSQKSHFHKGKSSFLREEHVFPVLASARTTEKIKKKETKERKDDEKKKKGETEEGKILEKEN